MKVKPISPNNRNVVPGNGVDKNIYVKSGDYNTAVSEINKIAEEAYTFTGVKTFSDGIVADITGDITGDVTGDVSGDVTGNLTGDSAGTHTGNVETDNISEDTASAGVSIKSNMLVKEDIALQHSVNKTTTGVTQTFPADATVIRMTSTTNADLANLPNTSLLDGQIYVILYVAEGAAGDDITVTPLNASDAYFTSLTFNAIGDSATLMWLGTLNKWIVLAANGTVVA